MRSCTSFRQALCEPRQPPSGLGEQPARDQGRLGRVDAQLQRRAAEAVALAGAEGVLRAGSGAFSVNKCGYLLLIKCPVSLLSETSFPSNPLFYSTPISQIFIPMVRNLSHLLFPTPSMFQVHPSMARELFAPGFVSCWSELDGHLQEQLVRR